MQVMIQDCSLVSFCCLLEWLYTGSCDFNLRVQLNASRRVAAKLSDAEMLEVMQLADQYCVIDLVTTIEVQLSEKILINIKTSTIETPTSQQSKLDSQLEQLLDELVG